jgi:hypothetical protein
MEFSDLVYTKREDRGRTMKERFVQECRTFSLSDAFVA